MKARVADWSVSGCWVEFEHGGRSWRFLVSPCTFIDEPAPQALKERAEAAAAAVEALNRGAP